MEKRSKQFDDIIKGKLEGLSPEMNPSDWIMMEHLLEWEGLTNASGDINEMRFDEVAIDKLQNIPVEDMVPDWERMSSMIDDTTLEPDVEPSEFDQAIDNGLKNVELSAVDMAIWDKMQPTLDADRAQIVADLDNVAKEKLTLISEIEPAWGSMQSKINRELFLPESVVKYRIIEVVLIALFAISLFQLPIIDNVLIKDETPVVQNESLIDSEKEESSKVKMAADQSSEKSSVDAVAQPEPMLKSDQALAMKESLVAPASSDLISSGASTNVIPKELSTLESTIDWNLPPTLNDLMFKYQDEDPFKVSRLAFNQAFIPFNPSDLLQSAIDDNEMNASKEDILNSELISAAESTKDQVVSPTAVNVVEALEVKDLENINFARLKVKPACATCEEDKQVGLVLSMFTGSDYNEIVTPFDPVYAQEGTHQWNLGYGGGLSIGMKFRNWELETGAIYASNQYSPREVFDIYSGNISSGYIASTLKDIELEVIKIPLNFRFNVNLWDNWKIYALSGASLNMVIQSEYITDDVFLGTKTFATPSAPSVQNTNLSLKDFGEGILEGGKFKDNSFLTANLGFGIERTLNRRWSIFAQPTYQRQIFSNGIGPNQDRFNAISLFLGTRVTIK